MVVSLFHTWVSLVTPEKSPPHQKIGAKKKKCNKPPSPEKALTARVTQSTGEKNFYGTLNLSLGLFPKEKNICSVFGLVLFAFFVRSNQRTHDKSNKPPQFPGISRTARVPVYQSMGGKNFNGTLPFSTPGGGVLGSVCSGLGLVLSSFL